MASGAVTMKDSVPGRKTWIRPAGESQPSASWFDVAASCGVRAESHGPLNRSGTVGTSAPLLWSSTTCPVSSVRAPVFETCVKFAANTSGLVAPGSSASRAAPLFQKNCSSALVRLPADTTVASPLNQSAPAGRNDAFTLREFCTSNNVANTDAAMQNATPSGAITYVAPRQTHMIEINESTAATAATSNAPPPGEPTISCTLSRPVRNSECAFRPAAAQPERGTIDDRRSIPAASPAAARRHGQPRSACSAKPRKSSGKR